MTKIPGTQAIDRALGVLKCFTNGKRKLRVSEISEILELNSSTTHRIVRALKDSGFLQQDKATSEYYLGPTTLVLGQLAHQHLGFNEAMPVLERVGLETSESANIGIRDDDSALVILRVESDHPLRFDQSPGTRVPLHCTAMGKAILAFTPDLDIDDLGVLTTQTEKTITDPTMLRKELDNVGRLGYSTDDEESIEGVRCVGAPILGRAGHAVAAIAVQAPRVRLGDSRIPELGEYLIKAADEISHVIPLARDDEHREVLPSP